MITYTGTHEDRKLLLAEGDLDPEDSFEVLTIGEVYARMRPLTHQLVLRATYTSWWKGYNAGREDAAVTPKDSWLKSLLRRFV